MITSNEELLKLRDRLRLFAVDRNWDQFHSPKNLAMALIAEAGELVEPFQWLTDEQSKSLNSHQLSQVQDEVADVFIYLVRLADKLGIDLIESANKKIDLNNERYPVSEAYGNAEKSKHSR
jgi:NTP pyrophosphatase (non-canonical NTP hydrolase)